MEPSFKIDLKKIISDDSPLIIELGCGQKSMHGRITVDKVDLPHVDIVADIENGLSFLPDNCVDEIHCRSVFDKFSLLANGVVSWCENSSGSGMNPSVSIKCFIKFKILESLNSVIDCILVVFSFNGSAVDRIREKLAGSI